ncbi:MAG: hypothetical protein IAI50_16755 [Candidatus Eremiobacteraeota bacterium]|nr:hypothetical protein [Candidatus Eremiobacteraeota bacterium]
MEKDYDIEVMPQHERMEYIASQLASTADSVTSHEVYEGASTPLKVIRVPIKLPLYRMANGRTQAAQASYIADKGLASGYFSAGEENDTVQQVQQRLLHRITNEGPDSITPIFDELERDNQTDPIMITPSGVVVNGNRRLMAMRMLYANRPADFPNFETVLCAVLPPLSAEEVDDIEVRLQMRPETKLPYGWISEALKVEKKLERKTEDAVARLMRKRVNDIKKVLAALGYARIYLAEWKKRAADYSVVEDGEQFFGDLVTRMRNKTGTLREANLRMAWVMFDNRSSLGGRLYDYNKIVGEKAEEVLTQLAERVDTAIEDEPEEYAAPPEVDDLEIDLGDEPTEDRFTALIDIFDDDGRRDEVFDQLRAVCQTILDLGKATKLGNAALMAARNANTTLTEIDLSSADPKTFDGIAKQVESVVHIASDLIKKVSEIKADQIATTKSSRG